MIRETLFAAIEVGRFDTVQCLAAEYGEHVLAQRAAGGPDTGAALLSVALRPLQDALHLLRIVRAHDAARYQQLASHCTYRSSACGDKGRGLNVDC